MKKLLCLSLLMFLAVLPVRAADNVGPVESYNRGDHCYARFPDPNGCVRSHLYLDGDELVRVEYIKDTGLVTERYSMGFDFLSGQTIPLDDDFLLEGNSLIWGGFFAGEEYNFVVLGQRNPAEDDSVEIIRIVKYDKEWNRLDSAGLYGENTTVPFDAGSLRFAEYDGILYLHTSHEMYAIGGINHQANMTVSLRESDLEVTKVRSGTLYAVNDRTTGYVSHSFNQFILADRNGDLFTLDHGDGGPRSLVLQRYDQEEGSEAFAGWTEPLNVLAIPGDRGDNNTGASLGGLAEVDGGYVTAFSYGEGAYRWSDAADACLSFTPRDSFTEEDTRVIPLTKYPDPDNGCYSAGTPFAAAVDPWLGYAVWPVMDENSRHNWDFYVIDTLSYVSFDDMGNVSPVQTVRGQLSDCQPIPVDGKLVWYVTDQSIPTFYTLGEDGLTAHTVVQPNVTRTLTFISEGETVETRLLHPGDQIGTPPTPAPREGYVFDGWCIVTQSWYSGAELWDPWEPGLMPDEDVTVTAKWSEDEIQLGETGLEGEGEFMNLVRLRSSMTPEDVLVIAAFYDGEDRQVNVSVLTLEPEESGTPCLYEARFSAPENAVRGKVFLLENGTCRPLTDCRPFYV